MKPPAASNDTLVGPSSTVGLTLGSEGAKRLRTFVLWKSIPLINDSRDTAG